MKIGNWPRKLGDRPRNHRHHKAPTWLATDEWDKDADRPVRWGFLVSHEESSFRWFKLGLVHPDDVLEDGSGELHGDIQNSDELKEAQALRGKHHASATRLTAAYLESFWNHIVSEVASKLGISEDHVKQSELHVAIGTPANSTHGTVSRLRNAAKAAGIPGYCHPRSELYVCMEPEAAAIALIEGRQVLQNLTVRWSPSYVAFHSQQAAPADVLG